MSTTFSATIEVEIEVDVEGHLSPDEIRRHMCREPWDKVEYEELEKYIQDQWSAEEWLGYANSLNATYKKVVWK